MDCPKVFNNLVAYLDGALDKTSSSQIKGHLASCHACKQEAQLLAKTWDLLDNYPALDLKPQVLNQTKAKVEELVREKTAGHSRPWTWKKIAGLATAAALLIGLGLAWFTDTFRPSTDPVIQIAQTQEVKELKVLLDCYTEFLEDLEEISEDYYDIQEKNGLEELPTFSISEGSANSSVLPKDKNIRT